MTANKPTKEPKTSAKERCGCECHATGNICYYCFHLPCKSKTAPSPAPTSEDNPQYRSGPGFMTCAKHSPGIDFLGACPYCADEKKKAAPTSDQARYEDSLRRAASIPEPEPERRTMSDVLDPQTFDDNLNLCYQARYHDGSSPDEPSYSDKFEAVREAMFKHDAAVRDRVTRLEELLKTPPANAPEDWIRKAGALLKAAS